MLILLNSSLRLFSSLLGPVSGAFSALRRRALDSFSDPFQPLEIERNHDAIALFPASRTIERPGSGIGRVCQDPSLFAA